MRDALLLLLPPAPLLLQLLPVPALRLRQLLPR
jgi:hypothetical protein